MNIQILIHSNGTQAWRLGRMGLVNVSGHPRSPAGFELDAEYDLEDIDEVSEDYDFDPHEINGMRASLVRYQEGVDANRLAKARNRAAQFANLTDAAREEIVANILENS